MNLQHSLIQEVMLYKFNLTYNITKATPKNLQHNLIWEFMLYEFDLTYNITKASRNICYAKDDGLVDHCTVTRWFKKFHKSCMKFDDQAR